MHLLADVVLAGFGASFAIKLLVMISMVAVGVAMTATLLAANADEETWSIVSGSADTAVVIPYKNVYQQIPVAIPIAIDASFVANSFRVIAAQAGCTVTQTTGVGAGAITVYVKRYVRA